MNGTIEQNIIRFINDHSLIEKGDNLLIAFSGGADSVFALHFFNRFKSKYGIEISAMHINHSLRAKESNDDELFCKTYCNKIGIQFYSETVNVKKFAKQNKQSIEEAARNLRYESLNDTLKKIGATKIVTAHILNDNTETILLNLFRGTGLSGASGIPIIRENIIRPLLSTSKEEILNYLNINNISFRTDSSNLENDFSRNFLRNEIIPQIKEKINSSIDLNLLRFTEIIKESNKIITSLAEDIIKKNISITDLGIEISNSIFKSKNEDIFSVAVKNAIEKKYDIVATFKDVLQIKALFSLQAGKKIDLSNKLSAIRERDFILVFLKKETRSKNSKCILNLKEEIKIDGKIFFAEEVDKCKISFSTKKNIEYINADKIEFPLTIRTWKNGDKFNPIGLNGTKTISDFLTEAKVKSVDKKNQLLLLNKDTIVWVVGHRIDEKFKINNNTKRIVKLWVK